MSRGASDVRGGGDGRSGSDMDRRGRVRLSTMEIVLLATLVGMLVLGLLQARREERLLAEHEAGEHQ
jgi:hypothetical protein